MKVIVRWLAEIFVRWLAATVIHSLFMSIRMMVRSVTYVILREAARRGIAPWVVALAASIAGALLVFLMAIYTLSAGILTTSDLAWLFASVIACWITVELFFRRPHWYATILRPRSGCVKAIAIVGALVGGVGLTSRIIDELAPTGNNLIQLFTIFSILTNLTIWLIVLFGLILSVVEVTVLFVVEVTMLRFATQWRVAQWSALTAGALLGLLMAMYVLVVVDPVSPWGSVLAVLLTFLGGWAISTCLLLRQALTVSRVISRAFLYWALRNRLYWALRHCYPSFLQLILIALPTLLLLSG